MFVIERDRNADLKQLVKAWIDELQWVDEEYGGWAVDTKRPFGNSGREQIADDILEILNIKLAVCPHCEEVIDEQLLEAYREYAHELFQEIPDYLKGLMNEKTI